MAVRLGRGTPCRLGRPILTGAGFGSRLDQGTTRLFNRHGKTLRKTQQQTKPQPQIPRASRTRLQRTIPITFVHVDRPHFDAMLLNIANQLGRCIESHRLAVDDRSRIRRRIMMFQPSGNIDQQCETRGVGFGKPIFSESANLMKHRLGEFLAQPSLSHSCQQFDAILVDCGFGDIVAKQAEFGSNSWRSPKRVFTADAPNESVKFCINRWSAEVEQGKMEKAAQPQRETNYPASGNGAAHTRSPELASGAP